MAVYKLDGSINKNAIKSKTFKTRKDADRYVGKLLDENNLYVENIIYRDNNHNQEYVCNRYSRFFVVRQIVL